MYAFLWIFNFIYIFFALYLALSFSLSTYDYYLLTTTKTHAIISNKQIMFRPVSIPFKNAIYESYDMIEVTSYLKKISMAP